MTWSLALLYTSAAWSVLFLILASDRLAATSRRAAHRSVINAQQKGARR